MREELKQIELSFVSACDVVMKVSVIAQQSSIDGPECEKGRRAR